MDYLLDRLRKNTGNLIVIIGILHLVSGVLESQEVFLEMWQNGIINTVDRNAETFGFFWFEMNGIFVVFTGLLIQNYLTECKRIPVRFGWYLFGITLFGCLLQPLTGFYVFVPVSLLIILQKKTAM